MGWGGERVGAGRKPKEKRAVSPFKVFGGVKEPEVESRLLEPPANLPTAQVGFWRDHAKLAVERRTLTPATVPAFRLLCELHAKKEMVAAEVDKGEFGGLRIYAQLAKQVEGLMARFCLAPFGKPTDGREKKPKINPWGSFGQAQAK